MKKRLAFIFATVIMLSMNSCTPEEKECEKNNTGELSLVNSKNYTCVVDIRGQSGSILVVPVLASSTLKIPMPIPVGTITIWVQSLSSAESFLVGSQAITQCSESTFTLSFNDCEYEEKGTLTVTNPLNINLNVDVRVGNSILENSPFQLGYQESQQLSLNAGQVSIWIKTSTSEWQKVAEKNIEKCSDVAYSIVAPGCFTNNTGDIVLTNANPFSIQVDIINSETGFLNDIRTLEPNASTTYSMAAGIQATIQVKPIGGYWTNVAYRTPSQCDTESYSWEYCNYGGNSYAKLVTVKNTTGYSMLVDVYSYTSSNFAGELSLSNGQTAYYYNVRSGNFKVWGKYTGGTWFYTTNTYSVATCGTFDFTWAPGLKSEKSKEIKPSTEYKPFESLGVSNIVK